MLGVWIEACYTRFIGRFVFFHVSARDLAFPLCRFGYGGGGGVRNLIYRLRGPVAVLNSFRFFGHLGGGGDRAEGFQSWRERDGGGQDVAFGDGPRSAVDPAVVGVQCHGHHHEQVDISGVIPSFRFRYFSSLFFVSVFLSPIDS